MRYKQYQQHPLDNLGHPRVCFISLNSAVLPLWLHQYNLIFELLITLAHLSFSLLI